MKRSILFFAALSGCTTGNPVTVSSTNWDLAPPPADQGIQLTVGPFDVPQNKEVQKNFFFKLPVDHDVWVNRIQIGYPQGSHHLNLFKTDHDFPDHVEDTFDAIPYDQFNMFAASQLGQLDWALPTGIGLKFGAHQQLLAQTHWVNAQTQRTPGGKGVAKINLWFAPSNVTLTPMGMLFAINKNLDIPPHQTSTATKTVNLARSGYAADVKIIAMTGHFHSRGRSFSVDRENGDNIYKSSNWDEPPFKRFDTPLDLKNGETLKYTSEFVNNTDLIIKFGPHVETEEHSNMFMYFYPGPADGKAVYDVNGLP